MPGKWWMRFKPLDEVLQICLVTSLLCWSQVLVIRCLRMLLRGLSMAASELFTCSAQWYTQWQSTYPLSQSALCYSAPSCEPSRNLHCAHQHLFYGHIRPDTAPEPVAAPDGEEAFLCISLEFIHVHDIMQAAHLLVVQMCWFCIMKVAPCMEEWQHLSNGVQMQGPVTCSLQPDEISNHCDGGKILYPKLGCLIQGSNFTKHVFHTLIQRNHGWVLHSISYTVLPMQDILIELAELCNFSLIQDIRGLEENGC